MMLALTAAFVGCFVAAHSVRGGWEALPIELCRFREEESSLFGWSLLALLCAIGLLHVWRLVRHPSCEADYRICMPMLGLLFFVAVTSSYDPVHVIASLMMLAGLFFYFALALNRSEHPLRKVHLVMPTLLLAIPPLGSFGSWQKGMILYLVLLINVQYFMLGPPPRKDKIRLTVKRAWKRRRVASPAGSVFVRDR